MPAPLASPADNFVCYSVRSTGTFTKINNVSVQDQFGTIHVNLVGIRQFCDPATLNGVTAGSQAHPGHLTCFKTALPNGVKFNPPPHVFIKNMFQGNEIFPDGHVDMLCVPSTKQVIS